MKQLPAAENFKTQWLTLSPTVRVALRLQGSRLLGLGGVKVNGVPLRSPMVPVRPDFATLDAIHYQDFALKRIVTRGRTTILQTTAIGRPELYSADLMDEYDFTLTFPATTREQHDSLDWILTPVEQNLDGTLFTGFSLGFKFHSHNHEIHRFTVAGTWEIGGCATGNTIYHQSQVGPPVYECTPDTHYTSACLKRLDLWNDRAGNSYQLCPRWGNMQPFDFQAARAGVLFAGWREPHAVKSLLLKNPGEEVIHVLDEYNFPLARTVSIPAKHVLFSPSPDPATGRPQHEVVNLWTRVMDDTTARIRGFYGIRQSYPLPSGGPAGKGKVCVDRSELAKGPQPDWAWREENGKFYYILDDEKVESHDYLYWLADKSLPQLQAKGVTRVQLIVHESDFTELAFAYHAQTGFHSDLHVSSVCGSHRYIPSQFYDGWRGWQYLATKARQMKITLGHWVGLHLTMRAAAVQEHPEYLCHHAHTRPFAGGYGHNTICSINWCSGAKEWFLNDLRRWHDEGLEFIWWDSWPNLACLPVNYGGRMEPMQQEIGKVFAELQKIGYNWFGFEGTSPFGVHAYGLADPMQDYEGHVQQGVAGQNDLGKCLGHEYLAYNQALMVELNPRRDRTRLPEWSFRHMANRSLTLVQKEHLPVYLALLPRLQKRYLLADDCGVRWEAEAGQQSLFAYRAFAFPVPVGAAVMKVSGTAESPVTCPTGILQTEPWTAYRIG